MQKIIHQFVAYGQKDEYIEIVLSKSQGERACANIFQWGGIQSVGSLGQV